MVDDINASDVGEVELIPLEGCTSKIWKYFGFLVKMDNKWSEILGHNKVTYCVCTKRSI